jgi:hypothetical protein
VTPSGRRPAVPLAARVADCAPGIDPDNGGRLLLPPANCYSDCLILGYLPGLSARWGGGIVAPDMDCLGSIPPDRNDVAIAIEVDRAGAEMVLETDQLLDRLRQIERRNAPRCSPMSRSGRRSSFISATEDCREVISCCCPFDLMSPGLRLRRRWWPQGQAGRCRRCRRRASHPRNDRRSPGDQT